MKRRLMKFGDFYPKKLNESSEEKDNAEYLLETDLLNQPFMVDLFGDDLDYVLDSDTELTSTGTDDVVWIEIKNIAQVILDQVDKDYQSFSKPFVEWAEKHDLYDAEITMPSPNEENSIIFKVNAGSVDEEETEDEEE